MESRETVLVVLEGVKACTDEKGGTAPLKWALCDIINPSDNLSVLIILNPTVILASPAGVVCCCMGSQQPSIPCKEDEYVKFANDQISRRREAYLECLRLHYNRCKSNGVKFQVKVAVGCQPMEIVIEEANNVKATWIILDRSFAGDHQNLIDDYNLAFVDNDEKAEVRNHQVDRSGNPKAKQSKSISQEKKPDILASTYYKILQEQVLQEKQYVREGVIPMIEKTIGETEISSTEFEPTINVPSCSSGIKGREEESNESEIIELETRTGSHDNLSLQGDSETLFVLRQPLNLCWEEILEITEGFRTENCICQQEEFEIYDGLCIDPDCHVMVKLFTSESNGTIGAERRVASSMSHQNILGLIGYHESANGTALVHHFAAKGTLDQYLHGYGVGEQVGLSVQSRMKIAIGIGRVVRYMHEECPGGPVVHGNLQPNNVFLSEDFSPLVSGFEQAIWLQWLHGGTDCSYNRCCHKNPLGHESMELVKSDVFSYGVLLLRLFCRTFEPMDDKSLVECARPILKQGAFHELLEGEMENADPYEIYRVMAAATKCTRTEPLSRPSMTQVVSMLRGENSCVVGSSPMLDASVRGGKYSLLY